MKKLMFLVSLVLIASFTLAACGPKPTPIAPPPTDGDPPYRSCRDRGSGA
ncbi:MAG: hypothetical protein Q7U96_00165 [Chloroflexota bacterium]|nr:hypothetical protein [Chloroflexota bacterium]